MIRFIHTADLHLDTPFRGLSRCNSDLAARLKKAAKQSFQNSIDLCIHRQADFLVISGDTFDSENQSLSAQLTFADGMRQLNEYGIPAYIICGNHDPQGTWLESMDLPGNCVIFGSDMVERRVFEKNGQDAAEIHGISYSTSRVEENLALKFNPVGSLPAVALLHGTIGAPGAHKNYAPFRMEDILSLGFDYWALGHIHKPQMVREEFPAVVYPGNPQGRDFGESGARGCCLVELEKGGRPKMEWITCAPIRFEYLTIELTSADDLGRMEERITQAEEEIRNASGQSSILLRIRLTGRTRLHRQLNRAGEMDEFVRDRNQGQLDRDCFSWIDRVEVQTRPEIDMDAVTSGSGFTAELMRMLCEYENDSGRTDTLLTGLSQEIKPAVFQKIQAFSPAEKQEILSRAKWTLLDHLTEEEE